MSNHRYYSIEDFKDTDFVMLNLDDHASTPSTMAELGITGADLLRIFRLLKGDSGSYFIGLELSPNPDFTVRHYSYFKPVPTPLNSLNISDVTAALNILDI